MTREILEQQMTDAVNAATLKVNEVSYKGATISISGFNDDAFFSVYLSYSLDIPAPLRKLVHDAKFTSMSEALNAVDKAILDSVNFATRMKDAETSILKELGYSE